MSRPDDHRDYTPEGCASGTRPQWRWSPFLHWQQSTPAATANMKSLAD